MAKKIKFGLAMPDGASVRTIEDLREHFDLETTIGYFLDGKLLEWLEDRMYEDAIEAVKGLSHDAPDFKQKLCDALGVAYEGDDISLEDIEIINAKKAKLKQLTSDEEIISHAAETAFSQEELADLISDGIRTIYLCGEEFHLPAKVDKCRYIGILGEPKVNIKVESPEQLTELGIVLEHVTLPEYLQAPKVEETESGIPCRKERRPYEPSKLFSSIIKEEDHAKVEKLYEVAQDILGNVVFDPDLGTRPLEKVVRESNLKGAFARWLEKNN